METTTTTPAKVQPKQPKIVIKVSNLEHLQKSASDLNKTSRKIRRLFEKNTYQKRTQLSVLKRYKRRLDTIERLEEERRQKASKRKVKLPSIKKFVGSFFAPEASKDPFKAIGALAAFNSLTKIAKGDLLGAVVPGLVAAGMVAGPALVGAGVDKLFNRGPNVRRGFDATGRRVSRPAQERYLRRYGDKAFQRRFGRQNVKSLQAKPKTTVPVGRVGKAFGRLGKSIIPGVGAVLGAVDAKMRADEGDITGSAISSMSATLDTATAASAATGIGLVATPFLGLASMTLDLINFARDITGMSEREAEKNKNKPIQKKLEEQTKKQKESVNKKQEDKTGLSFAKTLVGYERVVNKFDEFAKNFKGHSDDSDVIEDAASKIEDLGAGSTPISGPGYEFTQDPSFSQYLTGDINAPKEAYDASHGTVDNYHDHFAFKDLDTARRAAAFLQSKGIKVTELQGVGGGVTGPHSGAGSAHHRGLAFDVPGYQWNGSGAIGPTEYRGSAKVRAFMNDFYIQEQQRKQQKPATPAARPAARPATPAATPSSLRKRDFTRQPDGSYKNKFGDSITEEAFNKLQAKSVPRNVESYPSYDNQQVALVLVPVPSQPQSQPVQQSSGTGPLVVGNGNDNALNIIRQFAINETC